MSEINYPEKLYLSGSDKKGKTEYIRSDIVKKLLEGKDEILEIAINEMAKNCVPIMGYMFPWCPSCPCTIGGNSCHVNMCRKAINDYLDKI